GFQYFLSGGGLFNQGGTLTLTNSTLTEVIGDTGGCIFNNGGTVTLAQTTLTGCRANEGGALRTTAAWLSSFIPQWRAAVHSSGVGVSSTSTLVAPSSSSTARSLAIWRYK